MLAAAAPVTARAPLQQRVQQAWAAHQADPYRACALCDHGPRHSGHAELCTLGGQPRLRIAVARGAGGPCGPEAQHLRIDGWDLQS